jgi:hypothetical protein
VQPGPDGPRLGLLDHGLTLELEDSFVGVLARMVGAMRGGNLDGLTASLRDAGCRWDPRRTWRPCWGSSASCSEGVGRRPGPNSGSSAANLGTSVGDLPPRLLLVGRAIAYSNDGIPRQLDPNLDVMEVVGRHTARRNALYRGRKLL